MSAHYKAEQTKYKMFVKTTDEHPIAQTGDYKHIAQKNFEIIKQSIGLRTQINITENPKFVHSLKNEGFDMSGKGYVFSFMIDSSNIYGPGAKLLLDDLNGIVLHSKLVLKADGSDDNVGAMIIEEEVGEDI